MLDWLMSVVNQDSSRQDVLELKQRDQRILWTLLQVGEECPNSGEPRADVHQINELCKDKPWGKIPSTSLHRALDRLEEKGYIERSRRPQEAWERNDKPPVLVTMTPIGMERIGQGAIKAAMVEDDATLDDPTKFGDLQAQIGGVKSYVAQTRQELEETVEEYREDSIHYYGEALDKIDDVSDDLDQIRTNANKAVSNEHTLKKQQQSLNELEQELDELKRTVNGWKKSSDERLNEVEASVERLLNEVEQLADEMDTRKDWDKYQEARLNHIEQFLSEQFSGGFGKKKYQTYEEVTSNGQ